MHLRPVLVACALAALLPHAGPAQSGPPTQPPPTPTSVVVPTGGTAAQAAAEAYTGRRLSNLELADAIRSSGLTQGQLRDRLARAGFDPALADPFFAEAAATPAFEAGVANSSFVYALSELGLLATATDPGDPSGELRRRGIGETEGGRFGKSLFSGRRDLFDPVTSGPVDASYRIGVGDQVQLVLTGEVELAYQALDVRRDGTILLPQVGQVPIAGLTLEAARAALRQRASRVYSGLPAGRTHLDLSLTRIRSNQVFVIGDVDEPGGYQISALGTVFSALARAGGPTSRGSYRAVEVRRAGRTVQEVDLYNYLLSGDASQDIRLEQGDIVFVPLSPKTVSIVGGVRRPGLYELRESERFTDLLRFAGGFRPLASLSRIQIDRVLPQAQRAPGRDRAVIDIDLSGSAVLDTLTLLDADVVTVFTVGDLRRDRVVVTGEVNQPGVYQLRPGLTVEGLIEQAQGPLPWALTDRLKLFRSVRESGLTEIVDLDLADPAARRLAIAEFDSLVVLDARRLFPSGVVEVTGAVNRPGAVAFAQGQTLRDAIDLADGLREDALSVEVARKVRRAEFSDTASIVTSYALDSTFINETARTIPLERDDVVSVRSKPGYRDPRTVVLEGEFRLPGTYTLRNVSERVTDVVVRAGGLLPTASMESFRLFRDGRVVAIDLARALRGSERDNIQLEAGDRLRVSTASGTVQVSGAVMREVVIPFNTGWSLGDYVQAAGGDSADADRRRVFVEYASGVITTRRRFLGITLSSPSIRAGAQIIVRQRPPSTSDWRENIALVTQVTSVLASLVVAYTVAKQ